MIHTRDEKRVRIIVVAISAVRKWRRGRSIVEVLVARKTVSGFAEAGAAMAQQLDDTDLLNLFSAIGRVVSKGVLL